MEMPSFAPARKINHKFLFDSRSKPLYNPLIEHTLETVYAIGKKSNARIYIEEAY